jgi:TRAP-type mannitol/chloroaromatic compound transport system permease large subunit
MYTLPVAFTFFGCEMKFFLVSCVGSSDASPLSQIWFYNLWCIAGAAVTARQPGSVFLCVAGERAGPDSDMLANVQLNFYI